MSQIPDFTDTELWILRTALTERHGAAIRVPWGGGEARLNPESSSLTACPVTYRAQRGANFVIVKVDGGEYRRLFFYHARNQFGTGRDYDDNLSECVTIPLQVQVRADHERRQNLKAEKH